jgi:poly-gamma-glutamate synthesis protein (capsule biosynthesis protein)
MANILKNLGIIVKVLVGGGLFVLLFLASLRPEEVVFADLNGDGVDERIERLYGKVEIFQNDELIFETDRAWDVREIMVGDFTNNGKNELALYLWKRGNYGPSLPFWLDKNDRSYKQHLFLYKWDNGVKALWHSSNLPYINVKTKLSDFDGDGKNEIEVLERPYGWGNWGDSGQAVAVWQWDEWGFKNVWRHEI